MIEAREALEEAMSALRLLKPEAAASILEMLPECTATHPRAVATEYRKLGTQISIELKRKLGIRANSFMSEQALAELTDIGISAPLEAHYRTLIRAHFTMMRAAGIEQASSHPKGSATYSVISNACPVCKALAGSSATSPFPPNGCTCELCNIAVQVRISWIRDVYFLKETIDLVLAGDHNSLRFTCIDCENILRLCADHGMTADDVVSCAGCGRVFASYSTVREAAVSELEKQHAASKT